MDADWLLNTSTVPLTFSDFQGGGGRGRAGHLSHVCFSFFFAFQEWLMHVHIQPTKDTGKKQMESIGYLHVVRLLGGYVGLFGG